MKSPSFDYIKADSVEHAIRLLEQHGDDAQILAGGQTLMATLNMRLSEPALLIDITGIEALRGITSRGDRLHIGAIVTHTEIGASVLISERAPMLCAAVPHIAHRAIRNAGTWGGSIAYADPAAEWPCCLVALDGNVHTLGPAGARAIPATDFFLDLYTTALLPGELVTGADVPMVTTADWFAFDELARRHGDYAVVGLAVSAQFDGTATRQVRLGFLGLGATPLRAPRTEALLTGKPLDATTIEIALASLKAELDPMSDLHHSAETKRHLATVLARRLLSAANASRTALAV